MTGVVLADFLDEPRFDALGSLGIGILLVVIAATLAWEMSSLLVGEAARPERGTQRSATPSNRPTTCHA